MSNVRPQMRLLGVLIGLSLAASVSASSPKPPLSSGEYAFQHRFAEQPSIPSIPLTARIRGDRIELINSTSDKVFPLGVIESGTLMWHAASKQWIVGHQRSDRRAAEVGGCSDGPAVIDLERRIYWTC